MREYLFLFWSLVIAGMIIMTAAFPECRQAASGKYSSSRSYAVYNNDGDRIFVNGADLDARMSATNKSVGQNRF